MILKIDSEKFIKGLKYGVITEIVLFILYLPFYFTIFEKSADARSAFPLFTGGILLIIAGCIGPGRYFQDYKLFIFSPGVSASFHDKIPLSAVCQEDIDSAEIIINGQKIDDVKFVNGKTQIHISRDKVIDHTINKMYLQSGEFRSNEVSFTFFDFTEDMSLEEVDEFSKFDDNLSDLELNDLQEKFNKKVNAKTGSITLGLLTVAIIIMIIGTFL